MQIKPFHRLVLEAYNIHTTLRPALAKRTSLPHGVHAGALLNEQFTFGAQAKSDPDGSVLESLPNHEAHRVNLAWQLGIGVLMAEHIERERPYRYDLWGTPLATSFALVADRAVQAMTLQPAGGAPVPLKVATACAQLAALVEQFHAVLARQQTHDLLTTQNLARTRHAVPA